MKKILIVDDIEINRKILRKMLSRVSDFNIVEACNGKEAICLFNEESPDLILMDINMPDMDGYESTAAIKSVSTGTYIPVIFVTALSAEESLFNALASGGDDFIGKPFKLEVLASKINAHLRIRELTQQLNNKNKQLTQLNNNLTYEQELIEYFFESAIQQSFLDERIIKYHMSPISTFNGDILLVERGPQGGFYLLLGDFTGHGLTAAMGTLPVAMIFFKMVRECAHIGDIARELNHQLNILLPVNIFFAATLLELNEASNMLSIWMGGMPENYLLDRQGNLIGTIESKQMPLGILEDSAFNSDTEIYNVNKGDKVYLYSDGVTEATSPNNELFGNDRLKKILVSRKDDTFESVLKELHQFTGENSQEDDITLVEMTCNTIPSNNKVDAGKKEKSSKLPWHLSITLSEEEIRNVDVVSSLSGLLGALPVLTRHKGMLHVLLSEMYSNALDYSLLDMSHFKRQDEKQFIEYYKERGRRLDLLEGASIDFDFCLNSDSKQQKLKITMVDNGKGFKQQTPNLDNNKLHGRGLDMINSLCENISFSDDGRKVEAIYCL